MKNQSKWLLFSVFSLLLAACGQTPQPVLTYDAVSYDPVSNQSLKSEAEFQLMLSRQLPGIQVDLGVAAVPGTVNPSLKKVRPASIAPLTQKPSVLKLVISQQDECEPTLSGNAADVDKDGFAVSLVLAGHCEAIQNGVKVVSRVDGLIKDKDDTDPLGGYAFESIGQVDVYQGSNMAGLRIAAGLEDTRNSATDHTLESKYRSDILFHAKDSQGTLHNGKSVLNYRQKINVLKLEEGFDLNVEGSISGLDVLDGQSTGGKIVYSGKLHGSNSAGCKGIDSGSLTFSSGPYSVTLVYTGCNQSSLK
ncbi:hypothetical protein GCM10008938_41240 [Deinococcus roseus]|uniref:Lipoprotein n=2 Tax=Deinococcus roseus TaxID=392414 RepID=A0ABQ2D9T9_9DEIO|nr:hypothetical protein GCM10008938_41240 [Deinococcus roseus]